MGDDRRPVYREEGSLVIRASSLGSCIRDLVLHGIGEHEPLPVPDDVQKRFDAGTDAELPILERLSKLDEWELEGLGQSEYDWLVPGVAGVVVRFHPDEVGTVRGERRVIECKALSPSSYEQAKRKGTESLFNYGWQLSVMMLGLKLPAMWVALRKNMEEPEDKSGELHFEYVDKPPVPLGQIIKKVRAIKAGIDSGDLPDCSDPNQYPCPFLFLRPEKEDTTEVAGQSEEDRLADLAFEYNRLTETVAMGAAADKERKPLKDELMAILGNRGGLRGGGWRVTQSMVNRQRMAATGELYEVWTVKVEKVG